jgi:hypothetical protein
MGLETVGLGGDVVFGAVLEDDAVQLGEVDVLALGVVDERDGVLVLGALAELALLLLVAVVVVGLGQPVSQVVQVLVRPDRLQQLARLRGFVVDIHS